MFAFVVAVGRMCDCEYAIGRRRNKLRLWFGAKEFGVLTSTSS